MSLIYGRNIYLSLGTQVLLDHVNFHVEPGERVCLIGRNGMGKTTLLKLLVGEVLPDAGSFEYAPTTIIAYLPQTLPQPLTGTVAEVVLQGAEQVIKWLKEYNALTREIGTQTNPEYLQKITILQQNIEQHNGWNLSARMEKILQQFSLNGNEMFATLSGGLQRQVLLARALITEPDLLILDEPTNHLDIEVIEWLEDFLKKFKKSLLFITHDRSFMKTIATRILELDQGKLISWEDSYENFIKNKEAILAAEANQNALFDKKLSQEEMWIRQGIKARRTRNEGRVRALKKMRKERQERQERLGKVKITAQDFSQSGKVVFEAKNVSHRSLIQNFSTVISRGDKIGIIGPNGCGKTTLLKILLGEINPTRGEIKQGTRLNIAYFDQHRSILDDNKTVQENVVVGGDMLTIAGKPRHVMSYLQDFLFSPERARTLVKSLSGGERNRLLLARLFSLEANVLVMDEPTNDLDIETLELLEEYLFNYSGTLLLVSHDREFLNNVVTSTLVFEGEGKVKEYIGGYDDWFQQRKTKLPELSEKIKKVPKVSVQTPAKLSYKEKIELETLPNKIEALEKTIATLQESMMHPSFYKKTNEEIAKINSELKNYEKEVLLAYERWNALENKEKGSTDTQSR